METTIDLLLRMNKEINACISAEKEKLNYTTKQCDILQEKMVREIREDLLEYLTTWKTLGIRKTSFALPIELNPLGLRNEDGYRYYIEIYFYEDKVVINQLRSLSVECYCYNTYGIYSTRNERWGRKDLSGNSLNIIYENWPKIKSELESSIAKKYLEQKTEEIREINKRRDKIENILTQTRSLLSKGE